LSESYMGDEGVNVVAKSVVDNLKNLKDVYLDFGFNDIQGHGVPELLRQLATVKYPRLELSLSNNQF
jgi:hypothetical protein